MSLPSPFGMPHNFTHEPDIAMRHTERRTFRQSTTKQPLTSISTGRPLSLSRRSTFRPAFHGCWVNQGKGRLRHCRACNALTKGAALMSGPSIKLESYFRYCRVAARSAPVSQPLGPLLVTDTWHIGFTRELRGSIRCDPSHLALRRFASPSALLVTKHYDSTTHAPCKCFDCAKITNALPCFPQTARHHVTFTLV